MRKHAPRVFALTLILFLASVALEAGEKVKMTIPFRDDGLGLNHPFGEWFKKAYETYPKKDEIELDLIPMSVSQGDYFAKMALMLQSPATAPTMMPEDTFILPADAMAGYIIPLDEYLKNYPDWSDGSYVEAIKAGVTGHDGKVYGIPYDTDSRGLIYNKEIFAKAGLPTEWEPGNWQDILDACKAIKENVPGVVPFWCNSGVATGEATAMQTYEMLLYGTGERLIDQDGKWIVSSPGILASLEFIGTIYKGGFGPPLSQVLSGQANSIWTQQYMPKGRLGISLNGFWQIRNFYPNGPAPWPEYQEKLGFAAMPTSEGQAPGRITLSGGWAFSIPKHSRAQDQAFDFIVHAMKPEVYTDALLLRGNLSARTDVAKDPKYLATPFNAQATSFLEFTAFRPQDPRYSIISTHIQAMVEAVVTGTSPQNAMAQFASDVVASVGKENVVTLE